MGVGVGWIPAAKTRGLLAQLYHIYQDKNWKMDTSSFDVVTRGLRIGDFGTDLNNVQITRYACGAAVVVMFYDYFLTFPDVCTSIYVSTSLIRHLVYPWFPQLADPIYRTLQSRHPFLAKFSLNIFRALLIITLI